MVYERCSDYLIIFDSSEAIKEVNIYADLFLNHLFNSVIEKLRLCDIFIPDSSDTDFHSDRIKSEIIRGHIWQSNW